MDNLSSDERSARGRLQDLVRDRRTSLAAISRLIGRNPAYLQQYVTRGSPKHLEYEDLQAIAQFLGVSPRVIETRIFDDSRPTSRAAAPASPSGPNQREDWVDVPRLALDASAGPGAESAQEISFDSFRFSRRWLRENGLEAAQLTAIRVEGDSMEPTLRDGDEILVERGGRSARAGIYVVRIDEALMVKRLDTSRADLLVLISDNPAYPPVEVPAGEAEVIGRVVWKAGRL